MGFLVAQMVKNLPAMQETRVLSLGREDPWRRKWQSTLVFLPGEFHGQKSLAGYNLWSHRVGQDSEHTHTFQTSKTRHSTESQSSMRFTQ